MKTWTVIDRTTRRHEPSGTVLVKDPHTRSCWLVEGGPVMDALSSAGHESLPAARAAVESAWSQLEVTAAEPVTGPEQDAPVTDRPDEATPLAPIRFDAPARTGEVFPEVPNPAAVYLASLADGPGRAAMRSTLGQVAIMLGCPSADACPWHALRHRHVVELRTRLVDRYAPAAANKALSAIRGTLRAAWRLGLIPTDDYQRAIDVKTVRGSRLPTGRALDAGEITALFRACVDGTPSGARDAAAFSLMFGCGLRRAEAVAVGIGDYDPESGALRVIGKGNKERTVYAMNGGRTAVNAWIALRGDASGPLLTPVSRAGVVDVRPMTPQAIMMRLRHRAKQANIGHCSPHDLRRSFVSTALESGADLAMVQALAGHASPTTTARYDRRPETAKAAAAKLVHVPFVASDSRRTAPGKKTSHKRSRSA